MPIKTTQATTANDTKRRNFAPIRRDLLERLTRECETMTDTAPTPTAQPRDLFRKLRQR